ncbi:MAG: c-type cytochrome [Myxococcaceae bacterium]
MRRTLKVLGLLLAGAVLLLASGALWLHLAGLPRYETEKVDVDATPTPERLVQGKKLATLLCASCHMDPATLKLTGKHMPDVPSEFGPVYSKNITRHPTRGIGQWTHGEIAYLLRTGVGRDGVYIPPWMVKLPHLSDEDMSSILVFLSSDDPLVAPSEALPPGVTKPSFLSKLLSRIVFLKIPYPQRHIVAPSKTDKVAYGRYLAVALDCYGCHSEDFKTTNIAEPEKTPGYMAGGNTLPDLVGGTIRSANLTFDNETGLGTWSEADLARALHDGFRPDGALIRYPMNPAPELDNDDIAALYAYLKSLRPQRNAFPRTRQMPPPGSTREVGAYAKYGCPSCHGDNGVGMADLRQAAQRYPTDAALREWIDDAPKLKPGTRMPGWRGIIAEEDYAPLIAHVRSLGAKTASAPPSK